MNLILENVFILNINNIFLSFSFCCFLSLLVLLDYEAASSKAGKVENEVKRLHNLIVDINSHKLKAQQDKLDKINQELDECSSTITKAQVAIKTADRWGKMLVYILIACFDHTFMVSVRWISCIVLSYRWNDCKAQFIKSYQCLCMRFTALNTW